MEKISTAEEILEKYNKQFEEKGIVYNLSKPMIEYAKLHVEAQLKAILGNVINSYNGDYFEEIIVESYPLTNIK